MLDRPSIRKNKQVYICHLDQCFIHGSQYQRKRCTVFLHSLDPYGSNRQATNSALWSKDHLPERTSRCTSVTSINVSYIEASIKERGVQFSCSLDPYGSNRQATDSALWSKDHLSERTSRCTSVTSINVSYMEASIKERGVQFSCSLDPYGSNRHGFSTLEQGPSDGFYVCPTQVMQQERDSRQFSHFFHLNDKTSYTARGQPGHDPLHKIQLLHNHLREWTVESVVLKSGCSGHSVLWSWTAVLNFLIFAPSLPVLHECAQPEAEHRHR
ncbi:LOW QUALITY PROTEIN: hypothetical protein PoB_000223500 [Plakobranchus ocellatus]|uniref:Ig-like domain-containing protein n=1 Tax=Plakobranchus ocellatus TaxID=259542 RepID=A0AAV3XZ54_9GAST|nr:LOW QUALITY PROTEIN: hypothetical protein PoB_000223500 [Plakobranchus ocellatus]